MKSVVKSRDSGSQQESLADPGYTSFLPFCLGGGVFLPVTEPHCMDSHTPGASLNLVPGPVCTHPARNLHIISRQDTCFWLGGGAELGTLNSDLPCPLFLLVDFMEVSLGRTVGQAIQIDRQTIPPGTSIS